MIKNSVSKSLINYLESHRLLILILIAMLYLSQNLYLPVKAMDEAQQADYLQRIVEGQLPFRDFLDIYGPLNWTLPAIAYYWAENNWFGVRIYMMWLQIVILILVYRSLIKFCPPFYATATFMLCLFFLGSETPQNNTPYAFMQVYPLSLGVLILLLDTLENPGWIRIFAAGLMAGIAAYIKISSGLFLWLAGLLICFTGGCSRQLPLSNLQPGISNKLKYSILTGKIIVLLLYLLVFTKFIIPHFEKQYFWRLTLPLLIGLWLLLRNEIRLLKTLPTYRYLKIETMRWKNSLIFGISGVFGFLGMMLLWYPTGATEPMLEMLPKIIRAADYSIPFSPLGKVPESPVTESLYRGGWLHFPCIMTILIITVIIGYRITFIPPIKQHFCLPLLSWKEKYLYRLTAVWIIAVIGDYVIFPTADAGHLIQNMIIWIVFFGTVTCCVEKLILHGKKIFPFRCLICFMIIIFTAPLLHFDHFKISSGGKIIPDLRNVNYLLENSKTQHDREYLANIGEIADYIKTHSEYADECYTISKDQLINYYAGKPLYGGRETFLYYLIPHGRIDRDGFMKLVSMDNPLVFLERPPAFIVDHHANGGDVSKTVFPEIRSFISLNYRQVLRKGDIVLYRRVQ